jgi:hypothetical protein
VCAPQNLGVIEHKVLQSAAFIFHHFFESRSELHVTILLKKAHKTVYGRMWFLEHTTCANMRVNAHGVRQALPPGRAWAPLSMGLAERSNAVSEADALRRMQLLEALYLRIMLYTLTP